VRKILVKLKTTATESFSLLCMVNRKCGMDTYTTLSKRTSSDASRSQRHVRSEMLLSIATVLKGTAFEAVKLFKK